MSRYTGPTTKINRRFGMALFPENKAMQKKPYIPGQHGPHLRRRVTDYSMGLNEKQKLRFMFGLSEKQFRLTFERAKKVRGVTGEIFMQMLETRLDNVIYSLGFARTRKAARQFVTHGHVQVNGKKVDIASYACKPGDVVEENQVLAVIEAMKMETAITARTAGTVKTVRVKEGQPVKAKELLMVLE